MSDFRIERFHNYLADGKRPLAVGTEIIPPGTPDAENVRRLRRGDSIQLRQKRAEVVEAMGDVVAAAEKYQRDLSSGERARFDVLQQQFVDMTEAIRIQENIEAAEREGSRPLGEPLGMGLTAQPPRSLRDDQSMRSTVRARLDDADLSLDRLVRGMLTGNWRGAEPERRALDEGAASGGVLLPETLATTIVDLAQAQMRVVQADALTIPMTTSKLKLPRQTADPTLAWHAESDPIVDTDVTFDSVELISKTLPILCRVSLELAEDVDNLETVISDALAKAIANELDRVALLGAGGATAEPLGVKGQSGVTSTAVGAALDYDGLLDAQGVVRAENFEPNAVIMNPATATKLAKLRNAVDGNYLSSPPALDSIRQLTTTQILASEAYVGDFRQLLIGMRTQFSIRQLTERYIGTGEYGFFAYLRADIALAHGEAFNVLTGLV